MSSRVLRKLQSEQNTKTMSPLEEADSESEDSEKGQIRNRFDLLDEMEECKADNNSINSEANNDNVLHYDIVRSPVKYKERSVKKQKKKRQKKKSESTEFETPFLADEATNSVPEKEISAKPLLAVDLRHLNPDNEMKKIFGSKVVQSNRDRRGRGRNTKVSRLITPKRWPDVNKSGINMISENGMFRFEHSKQYQGVQHEFLEAVETSNPDLIAYIIHSYPYHIDSLIQLSDLYRLREDYSTASELLERALYSFESSFHPCFNLATGNSRLDYRYPENRSFFISLFKHLNYVGQRGCCRTALELSKVLLSLDPEGDPLGTILVIDYFALRSGEYSYLLNLYEQWNGQKNLNQLPNFAYSIPLALFLEAQEQNTMSSKADTLLQNALISFPNMLLPLIAKCAAQLDPLVQGHNIFAEKSESNKLSALEQLLKLFVCRNFVLWKDPKVLNWLEQNAKEVIGQVKENKTLLKDAEEKCRMRFKARTPKNVLRHILLSGIEQVTVALPPELAQSPIFCFDPLPPSDSIETYAKKERTRRPAENRSMLGMFLHSLMPNYDPTAEANLNMQEEEGAVAERPGTELQTTVTNLLDAMSDLLRNIHLAPPPVENSDFNEQDDDTD